MRLNRMIFLALASALLIAAALPCGAQQDASTFSVKLMTPETALTAARAALDDCRRQGYQVAVAVVDRFGSPQVLLRDRFAGPHTVGVATDKAWTAASFRTATGDLGNETQAGKPMSALRSFPRVLAAGGGQVIESAGVLLGGIGVSGAPGGDADDTCAKAGVRAITDILELQG
ncbi:MAG: heme-binding protein [Burkholderiaceae bacterium]